MAYFLNTEYRQEGFFTASRLKTMVGEHPAGIYSALGIGFVCLKPCYNWL
jgi:hypothetical protein